MIKGHKDAIDLFQSAATDSRDSRLATLASEALPTILDHYRHARELARREDSDSNPPPGPMLPPQ